MVSIKPAFQSTKPDDPEAFADGQITPSRWNADLATLMATARILGRTTAGTGPIEELDAATARTLLGIILGTSAGNVPVLDGSGKLATSVLPESVVGALKYKGGWNAATNSPAIPVASSANLGWYYIVTTAGTTTVSGVSDWQVGDWIVSNGSSWDKVDSSDQVIRVAGLQGDISAAALRAALSLVVGTNVQAYSALLGQVAALNLSGQDGKLLGVSGGAFALITAGGGALDWSRSGFIKSTSLSVGTGEDAKYIDITIPAVSDVNKCEIEFTGCFYNGGDYVQMASTGSVVTWRPAYRLTSTTNLRLSAPAGSAASNDITTIVGRWRVGVPA